MKRMSATRTMIRLLLSGAFGLGVTLVPLGLVAGGARSRDVRFERSQTRGTFKHLDGLLEDYHQKHGRYPANLGAVSRLASDGWGRPLLYFVREGKPLIESLGRDGARGGIGTDADLSNRNPKPAQGRLPFWTRISDADALPTTAFALLCGAFTALLAFAGLGQPSTLKTWLSLGLQLLVALGIAFVGAVFITFAHLPSGH